jgi:hypothetical protein
MNYSIIIIFLYSLKLISIVTTAPFAVSSIMYWLQSTTKAGACRLLITSLFDLVLVQCNLTSHLYFISVMAS